MNVIVTGRHFDVSEALRAYAEEKVRKFDKYLANIKEANVTLSVEKFRHKAEVALSVDGTILQAEGVTEEMYASVDDVIDKLSRQVKKFKDKNVTRRKKGTGDQMMMGPAETDIPALEEDGTEEARIILKKVTTKPMSPEEAADQMAMMELSFFVFNNAINGNLNVVYRRKDNEIGLIQPVN